MLGLTISDANWFPSLFHKTLVGGYLNLYIYIYYIRMCVCDIASTHVKYNGEYLSTLQTVISILKELPGQPRKTQSASDVAAQSRTDTGR